MTWGKMRHTFLETIGGIQILRQNLKIKQDNDPHCICNINKNFRLELGGVLYSLFWKSLTFLLNLIS